MTSKAADVIAWIEKHLRYPSGPAVGERVALLDHERDFITGALGESITEAALSMPRGNSKTGLCSMIGAAAIAPGGPLVVEGGQVAIVASSVEQGRPNFDDILYHVRTAATEEKLRKDLKISDSFTGMAINNLPQRARLRVMGSDPKRAHGLRLSLGLLDEPAQWISTAGRDNKMFAAIRTALGKIPGGRLIALGTRPEQDGHWFQRLLENDAPHVHAVTFAAPPDTPDDALADVWLACNPLATANATLRDTIEREAGDLSTEPLRSSFRALRLNLGTPDTASGRRLVADREWLHVERGGSGRTGGFVLGVDLGSRSALSAVAAAWGGGGIDVMGLLGSRAEAIPVEDERLSRSASPVPSVEELLFAVRARWGDPVQVVADNYRSDELATSCQAFGWPLELRHTPEAAHAALVAWDATLADLILPDSPLLDWCVAGARVVKSSAGLKLARDTEGGRSSAHRDDPVAALIPAVAARVRLLSEPGPVTTVRML